MADSTREERTMSEVRLPTDAEELEIVIDDLESSQKILENIEGAKTLVYDLGDIIEKAKTLKELFEKSEQAG